MFMKNLSYNPIEIFFPSTLFLLYFLCIVFLIFYSEFIEEEDFELLFELMKSHYREEFDPFERRLKEPYYLCIPKAEGFLLLKFDVSLDKFLEVYLRFLSFFKIYSASALLDLSGSLLSFLNRSYSLF